MAFREYNQNLILASSSRLMEILFISKLNDHPVQNKHISDHDKMKQQQETLDRHLGLARPSWE
jgi:hypothetical protein